MNFFSNSHVNTQCSNNTRTRRNIGAVKFVYKSITTLPGTLQNQCMERQQGFTDT